MAIRGSFFKSKGPDIAGAFTKGQDRAIDLDKQLSPELEQEEDKESTDKPQVEEKSQEQTQTPNGGGGNGGGGNGGGRGRGGGLFARKEGGTRMGNLLRSIGSVFTKSKG